jgi:site-specific DNA-methyltransferase (adenine-specific)
MEAVLYLFIINQVLLLNIQAAPFWASIGCVMTKPYYQEPGITVYNCDCREILPELPKVDLVLTDPPYNIKKDDWDSITNYYEWLSGIFKTSASLLKENGTFWFFHMNFRDLSAIHTELIKRTKLRHKQLIIINKGLGSVAGRCNTEVLRSFPRATEYLQFYTFEDLSGAEQLAETFARKNPMAKYLNTEFKRAGINQKEIAKLFPSKTGNTTGCVSNWLIGYNFPLKEQYEKMRERLNYEYLKKDYEDLRLEYERNRYIFNLPMQITDVWEFDFYKDLGHGHLTVKPLPILKRIIETATNQGYTILDPFAGVLTTARAAKDLGKQCICVEKEERYCEAGVQRLKQEVLL